MQRLALENGSHAVEDVRRLGVLFVVGRDEEDTICAVVRDTETQEDFVFLRTSVQDGAVLQKGQQVSYILTESPGFPGEMRVARVRVEDPTAKRRGTVTQWDGKKNRGIITEDGADRQAHRFSRAMWPEGDLEPQQGMAVEFIRKDHNDQKFAHDIVLVLELSASEESTSSQTNSPTTSVGHTTLSDSNGKAYLLWDFDQVCDWTPECVTATFIAIVDRLVSDCRIADRAHLKSTAYGNCFSLTSAFVVHALDVLGVDVKLQSGLATQQVDRQLERDAEDLAALPDTSTMVIISSDTGFSRLIHSLAQKGKHTVLFHEAPAGSSHEKKLCFYAHQAYNLAELGVPEPEVGPSTNKERHRGWIVQVKEDKKKELYGFIRDHNSRKYHWFHSRNVAHNVELKPNVQVSFLLEANRRSPSGMAAVYVEHAEVDNGIVVTAGSEVGKERRVGRIDDVKEDKNKLLFGYIKENSGEEHFFHSKEAPGVPMQVGQFVSFSVVANAGGRTQTAAVCVAVTAPPQAGGLAWNRRRASSQPRQAQPHPDVHMHPPPFQEITNEPRAKPGPNREQRRAQSAQRPASSPSPSDSLGRNVARMRSMVAEQRHDGR
eukprot:EG_transcript_4979